MRKIFENLKPNFEKGGKLEKYHPVFESFETLFFVPGHTTKSGAHIKDSIDMKRTMITVVLAMIPCLLFGIWNTGHQHYLALGELTGLGEGLIEKMLYGALKVVPIIAVSYTAGLTVEFIFGIKNGHSLYEGFLVSGMLIPLIMPVDVPLWMVAVATIFAVLIGKEVFGGTGMNILNPALTARAFLFFAYPTKMSGDMVWIGGLDEIKKNGLPDGVTGATALGDLATTTGIEKTDPKVIDTMTKFADGGIYSFYDSFMGWIPGSVGETSALACLLGAALLLYTGIASWRVMVSFLAGGVLMGYIFNLAGVNAFMDVNPFHQVVLGGFMFGMVFMATDPVSAAQTTVGKWIYGFLGGFLAILIRVFNPAYPEGVMLAILFVNVMAPMIDHYVVQSNVKKRLKRLKTA